MSDTQSLTEKQRDWLRHVNACSGAGTTMKAYAERHKIDVRQLYAWKGRLSKLGLLPQQLKKEKNVPSYSLFEQVHVTPPAKPGHRCNIHLPNNIRIEYSVEGDIERLGVLIKVIGQLS